MLDDERWPTSPYSQQEQQRIMRDLHVAVHQASVESDEERLRNLSEINY